VEERNGITCRQISWCDAASLYGMTAEQGGYTLKSYMAQSILKSDFFAGFPCM
jgi:hypothetical protein